MQIKMKNNKHIFFSVKTRATTFVFLDEKCLCLCEMTGVSQQGAEWMHCSHYSTVTVKRLQSCYCFYFFWLHGLMVYSAPFAWKRLFLNVTTANNNSKFSLEANCVLYVQFIHKLPRQNHPIRFPGCTLFWEKLQSMLKYELSVII